jgi:hypothetical protein
MTLKEFESGINTNFSTELNSNFSATLTQSGMSLIEILTDRAITYSKGKNIMVGEAYTSAPGRQSSVDTGSTDATFFNGNKYVQEITEGSVETKTHNTFEGGSAVVSATLTANTDGYISSIRFSPSGSGTLSIKNSTGDVIGSKSYTGGDDQTISLTLADYSDFIRSGTFTIETSGTINRTTIQSYSGTDFSYTSQRVFGSISTTGHIGFIDITQASTSEVYHDIDTGITRETPSSLFFGCKLATFPDGANVRCKVINGSEDSGWKEPTITGTDNDEVQWTIESFTAFTAEATQYIVELSGGAEIYGSFILLE